MKTFVQEGDRVLVHQGRQVEGQGVVTKVHERSEMESAYVNVLFDNDEYYGSVPRWILPTHKVTQ